MTSTENSTSSPSATGGATQSESKASVTDRSAAIQEGKDKAKAVMAASGIGIEGRDDASQSKDQTAGSTPSSDDKLPNGQVASRKRSRSGSRKPTAPRTSHKGIYNIDDETDRFRFLTFHERDNDFNASLNNTHIPWHRALIGAKTQEMNYLRDHVQRLRMENPAQVFGPGYLGYGNGSTDLPPVPGRPGHLHMLVYPHQKPRLGKRRTPRVPIPRTDMTSQAELGEELVPIRLDIEHDKIKLRDTFTWNLHDHLSSPELFAQGLVEDFKIPPESAASISHQVTQKMKEQLVDFYPHIHIQDNALDDQLPYHAYKNDEMRILIKLNITIGAHTLVDQFEWEINNPLNNPEEFALAMAKDMSLSGEFTTAIAHQIREQSQMFTKSLFITAHPFDGRPIEDADVRDNFLSTPLPTTFRPFQMAKEYTPYLYELSDADLQREELSILRDQRRQKRSVTRRGGPALPDLKDRERTIRSLIISSVLPGAAESLETARIFKYSRSSGRSRRPGRTDDAGESEESDSEDSENEIEPPQPTVVATSRGRIIRGAASAAQAAMKANFGRSATPEVSQIVHEPKSVSRRPVYEQREDTPEEAPQSLIVRLRVPKDIFRQWIQNPRLRLDRLRGASRSATPRIALKAGLDSPAPSSASRGGQSWEYDEHGRVEVSEFPRPNQEVIIE
jgi:SWI/SNF-related matrix-associated actin-dependent regulator of chromatin subfamily B protein 1